MTSRAAQRGLTLVEILVALAIITIVTGGMVIGVGAISSARLRESASTLASAIRIAYNHANATSRVTRIVLDLGERTITIEDTDGRLFLEKGSQTGGAAAATDIEAEAIAESERVLSGPRSERASFAPVGKLLGFEVDEETGPTKKLGDGIYFRSVEVEHEDSAVTSDRVYVYFFPGGQAERAAIQLQKGQDAEPDPGNILTITVAPLTGKIEVLSGPFDMPRPLDEREASELEDTQ
jgi:general secretion pathway protein H